MKPGSDISTIEVWYSLWAPEVYSYCYRILGNTQDAEDIMQDSFIEAQQKMKQLKDADKQKSWLFSIARNKAINYITRNKERFSGELDESVSEVAEMEEDKFEWSEISRNEIIAEIDNLPIGYRTICSLYLFQDMNHEEIAATLGINASTSRSQYFRAKKLLQQQLIRQVKNG